MKTVDKIAEALMRYPGYLFVALVCIAAWLVVKIINLHQRLQVACGELIIEKNNQL